MKNYFHLRNKTKLYKIIIFIINSEKFGNFCNFDNYIS